MKLTKGNIKFVKEHTLNGNTYGYFVKLKDGDSREYRNDDNTCIPPKTVQHFVGTHRAELWSLWECAEDKVYTTYIYQ